MKIMNCGKIRKKMAAFIDGELNSGEKSVIEAHINDCGDCRAELDSLKKTDDCINIKEEIEPSVNFRAKLRQELDAMNVETRVPSFKWLPVPLAAAAFVLVFSAFTVFTPLIYAKDNPDLKSKFIEIAKKGFTCHAGQKMISPMNFSNFCNRCSVELCAACTAKGDPEKCIMHKGENHENNK